MEIWRFRIPVVSAQLGMGDGERGHTHHSR